MGGQVELLEKQDAALAGENKPVVPAGRSNINKVGTESVKLEVLQLIVDGNTNKRIAQKLYRTERTVEYHRNRLMGKLDAHNAADLVKRAIAMGIL